MRIWSICDTIIMIIPRKGMGQVRNPTREERKLANYIKHVMPVFLAACLVIVALIPVYVIAKQQAGRRVTQTVNAQLEAGLSSVARKIDVINTLLYNFAMDPDTLNLAMLSDAQLSSQHYFALYYINKRLGTISHMDLLGQRIIVQFRSNSVLLIDDHLFDDKTQVYGSLLCYEGMDFEHWQSLVLGEMDKLIPASNVTILSIMTEGLALNDTCFITLNQSLRPRMSSTVATSILLPVDRLYEEILPGYSPEECLLVLADSGGELLYDGTGMQGVQILSANGDGKPLRWNGEDYIAFAKSNISGFCGGVAVPKRLLYADVAQVMRMIYLFIIVALACAALYCGVYAYIYFRPMFFLIDRLSDMGYAQSSGRLYESMQDALNRFSSDRESLRRQVDEAAERTDAYVLQRAVSGATLTAAEQEILSRKKAFMDRYIVTILEYNGRDKEERRLFLAKATAVLAFQNEMEDVMEENRLMCVYSFQDSSVEEELNTAFGILSKSAEERVSMAVSAVHSEPQSMPEAVLQAEEALRRARLAVKPTVTWYEEGWSKEKSVDIPFTRYVEFSACLMNGDKLSAHAIIETIRSEAQAGQLSPEYTIRAIGNLRGAVFTAAAKLGEDLPSAPLSEEKTPWRSLCQIDEWVDVLCASVDRDQESRSAEQLRQIMEYMGNQYTDPNFSLVNVAEKFNMSEKYLSKVIRKQTGKTYSAHIESLRMEHAKSLLSTTRMTVDEVAQTVGYEHANTFYKAFKRHYGYTPNDLRQASDPCNEE